jgi:hypothetical protein
MTIKVGWFNSEKTIILQKREPGWTWKDFDAAVDQYVDLARSVDHKTAIIIDCLDAPNPPSSSVLSHYSRAGDLKPENLVRMVIVSEERGFMETTGRIYTSVATGAGRFLHFVRTIEEAEALCYEVLTLASNADQSS